MLVHPQAIILPGIVIPKGAALISRNQDSLADVLPRFACPSQGFRQLLSFGCPDKGRCYRTGIGEGIVKMEPTAQKFAGCATSLFCCYSCCCKSLRNVNPVFDFAVKRLQLFDFVLGPAFFIPYRRIYQSIIPPSACPSSAGPNVIAEDVPIWGSLSNKS